MNIIGLGTAGCQIAEKFQNYGQYNVFCIDTENKGYSTFLPIPVENSHEQYEKNYKGLNLHRCRDRTTLILSGAGKISGCALRVLEEIPSNELEIIYVKSDEASLSSEAAVRDKVVMGVLQEYARSAKLQKFYIVSNRSVEAVVENVSIKNYWDEINNIISSTYHMINVFKNTEPLLASSSATRPSARIGTFGVVNFETGNEKLFYDLQYPRHKEYFYGISSDSLDSDKEMLHKIRSYVESCKEDKVDVGFSIYSTDYEHNYVYSVHFASYVQEQNIEE